MKILVFAFALLLLLSVASVSANVVISGKIYDSGYKNEISGVDVQVKCESNTKAATLSGSSYGAAFNASQCSEGSTLSVTATKGSMTGTNTVTLNCGSSTLCDIDSLFLVIMNVLLDTDNQPPATVTSSGGRGRLSVKEALKGINNTNAVKEPVCGNNVCETGETAVSCPVDCKFEEEKKEERKTGISALTGAVVGAFSGTRGVGIVVLIIILIIVAVVIRSGSMKPSAPSEKPVEKKK